MLWRKSRARAAEGCRGARRRALSLREAGRGEVRHADVGGEPPGYRAWPIPRSWGRCLFYILVQEEEGVPVRLEWGKEGTPAGGDTKASEAQLGDAFGPLFRWEGRAVEQSHVIWLAFVRNHWLLCAALVEGDKVGGKQRAIRRPSCCWGEKSGHLGWRPVGFWAGMVSASRTGVLVWRGW